jgi:hypothetical protein
MIIQISKKLPVIKKPTFLSFISHILFKTNTVKEDSHIFMTVYNSDYNNSRVNCYEHYELFRSENEWILLGKATFERQEFKSLHELREKLLLRNIRMVDYKGLCYYGTGDTIQSKIEYNGNGNGVNVFKSIQSPSGLEFKLCHKQPLTDLLHGKETFYTLLYSGGVFIRGRLLWEKPWFDGYLDGIVKKGNIIPNNEAKDDFCLQYWVKNKQVTYEQFKQREEMISFYLLTDLSHIVCLYLY